MKLSDLLQYSVYCKSDVERNRIITLAYADDMVLELPFIASHELEKWVNIDITNNQFSTDFEPAFSNIVISTEITE